MAQGQIEQSLKHFTQAYNQARQQHLAAEAYNQLCSIGLCHSRMQHFDKAAKCYDQVITYATRHKNAQLAFSAYQNYGAMCSRMGRVEDCQRLLLNALKYQSAADPALRVSVYAGLGTILTYNAATSLKPNNTCVKALPLRVELMNRLLRPVVSHRSSRCSPNNRERYAEIPALIALGQYYRQQCGPRRYRAYAVGTRKDQLLLRYSTMVACPPVGIDALQKWSCGVVRA